MPAKAPVPLAGTIVKNSSRRSVPPVVAEWAKLNVPAQKLRFVSMCA